MVNLALLSIFVLGAIALPVNSAPHPVKEFSDKYVSQTVDWINQQGINCGQNQHPMCETISVSFNEGRYDPNRVDHRQTILILDSGMELSSVLRYRSRIKAHYSYDPSSKSFIQSNPSVAISQLGKKLLSELDGFYYLDPRTQRDQPGFLASAWLRDLALAYGSAAPSDNFDHITGVAHFSHGSKVIGYLAQHNPLAEFVLVDTATFLPLLQHNQLVCQKNNRELKDYMQQAASSLRNILNNNGVEYINFSGGFTRSHVHQAWQRNGCSETLSNNRATKLLRSLEPIYDVLFNSPNILGVHSGKRDTNNSEDALDVTDYVNRIRAYPYTTETVNTQISDNGQFGWQRVFNDFRGEFQGGQSIDMYVNFGYGRANFSNRNQTPKMTSDVFGMQYAPDWALLSSSWAAPIVTSYAINTQNKIYQNNPSASFNAVELKNKLLSFSCFNADNFFSFDLDGFIREGEGMCRIHDPLKNRSDELNRLGYLSN